MATFAATPPRKTYSADNAYLTHSFIIAGQWLFRANISSIAEARVNMRLHSNHHIQVVIADRSARARDGLHAILKTQPDIEVVGKTDQAAELFVLVAATQPQVIFLDAHLAGLDVIETTHILKERWPKIKVVVTSLYTDRQAEVLAAGADTFLVKGCPAEDLIAMTLGQT